MSIVAGLGLGLVGLYFVLAGSRAIVPDEARAVADLLRAKGGEYEFDVDGHVTMVTTTFTVRTNGGEPEIYRKREYYSAGHPVRRVVETPTRETIEEVDPAKGVYGEARVTRDQVFLAGVPLPPRFLIYGGASLVGIALIFVIRPWSWFRGRA